MFARAVLRERRLPFQVELENDPFYDERNLSYLRRIKNDIDTGLTPLIRRELVDADDEH